MKRPAYGLPVFTMAARPALGIARDVHQPHLEHGPKSAATTDREHGERDRPEM